MIQAKNSIKGMVNTPQKVEGKINVSIIRINPELEDLEVTPSNVEQKFKSEKDGYSNVIVKGDENLIPKNIRAGVQIFDVNGELEPVGDEELTKELQNRIEELETEIATYLDNVWCDTGNPISINDSLDLPCRIHLYGTSKQETNAIPTNPIEVQTVGQDGNVKITVLNEITKDTQTKILSIQEEMLENDYIEDAEHHSWGKIILTGEEEQWFLGTVSGYLFCLRGIANLKEEKYSDVLCSHYMPQKSWSGLTGSSFGISCSDYGNDAIYDAIIIKDSRLQTLTQYKTFLKEQYQAGTPVTVYYKLNTPKDLELTEEQKEVLNGFKTYRNKTNISADGIGTLKVFYKRERE